MFIFQKSDINVLMLAKRVIGLMLNFLGLKENRESSRAPYVEPWTPPAMGVQKINFSGGKTGG